MNDSNWFLVEVDTLGNITRLAPMNPVFVGLLEVDFVTTTADGVTRHTFAADKTMPIYDVVMMARRIAGVIN